MASSNVDYYSKQKELQDLMHEHEQKRIHLEQQFKTYCKKDERLHDNNKMQSDLSYIDSKQPSTKAKLRATKLQSYWKKICEDQRRSQARNQQILRDFERVDTHLATLTAKTERLRLLKRQYEEYIERTYPQWRQQVLNYAQQHGTATQQHTAATQQPNAVAKQHDAQFLQQQQELQQRQQAEQLQRQQQQWQQQQQQQFDRNASQQPADVEGTYGDGSLPHRSYYMEETSAKSVSVTPQRSHDIVIPSQHAQQSSTTSTPVVQRKVDTAEQMKSSVYTNASEVAHNTDVTRYVDSMRQRTPSPKTQIPAGQSPSPVRLTAERDTEIQTEVQVHQNDISASEDLGEVGMSQPIQSVTVKGPGINSPARVVDSPGPSQSSGLMEPEQDDDDNEEEDDDDDVNSEFDVDLPSGHQAPTPSHQGQHDAVAIETGSLQSSPDEDEIPQIKASVQPKGARAIPSPELTTHGIIRLIRHVQNEFPQAVLLEGYYRSHPPNPAERLDIIHKANAGQNLDGLDGVLVSMVVLEQVTLVIRSLQNTCLLPDSVLAGNVDSVTQAQVRAMLRPDAQPLWDCLFDHLIKLVKDKVMVTNEVAAVFVPCIVLDKSQHQDKAFSLLIRLISEQVEGKSEVELPTPREGLDSITRSSLGGVPPLKFGSLVDTRQYSDDDTSQLTQSVTSQKIPLNATEAYRSMLSGSTQQRPQNVDDEEEDTDEDVEKQFASTLSPRESSSPTKPPGFANTAHLPPSQPTPEPPSESSSVLTSKAAGAVYVPTAIEHQSGKPTPRSAAISTVKTPRSINQPLRKPGIHIQSDLDTDTEIDILKQQPQQDQKEDDFFEFYE